MNVGDVVTPGTALFTIIDPSVVWLKVNVPAANAAEVGRGSGATFQLEGGVVAHINSSWDVRVRRDDLVTFQVDGTHGSACGARSPGA